MKQLHMMGLVPTHLQQSTSCTIVIDEYNTFI